MRGGEGGEQGARKTKRRRGERTTRARRAQPDEKGGRQARQEQQNDNDNEDRREDEATTTKKKEETTKQQNNKTTNIMRVQDGHAVQYVWRKRPDTPAAHMRASEAQVERRSLLRRARVVVVESFMWSQVVGGGVCGLGGLIGYVVIGIAFPVEVDLQSRIRLDDRVDVGDEVHARDFVGSDDDQPLALGVGVVVDGEGLGSGPGV